MHWPAWVRGRHGTGALCPSCNLAREAATRASIVGSNNGNSPGCILDRNMLPVRGKGSVRRMGEWMTAERLLPRMQIPDEDKPRQGSDAGLIGRNRDSIRSADFQRFTHDNRNAEESRSAEPANVKDSMRHAPRASTGP